MTVNLPLPEVPIGDYGDDEAAMVAYRAAGTERALAMPNRGPIRYTADGSVHPDILADYEKHGFYVFTSVIGEEELLEIEADVASMLDRCPVHKDSDVDRFGRPALGVGHLSKHIGWVRPLSDPVGGTAANNGRHQAKMIEPTPPVGAPDHVIQVISGSLQFGDAFLRVYVHPDLMRVTEAINGTDFTPFNEVVWIKAPGLGGAVAWHQDPWTHWDSDDLDAFTHGFNWMAQLYGCDAANGLWVVPGSHIGGRADIKAMVAQAGSDRLPDAVPLICGPGDVAIMNRQAIHGSFANTSPNPRVTINFGFHKRSSIVGVTSGGVHNPITEYTPEHVFERSKVIGWGLDARRTHFPDEKGYTYEAFAGRESEFAWNDKARAEIKDYNLRDLGI